MSSPCQVYFWLKDRFGVSEECWTSRGRSDCGYGEFRGREVDYADFTVPSRLVGDVDSDTTFNKAERNMSRKVTEWLTRHQWDQGHYSQARPLTYHFEVKTTLTNRYDKFTISAGQYKRVSYKYDIRV